MDDIYREFLLDHYHSPRNKGVLKNPDIHKHDINISCGDEVEMFVKLDGHDPKVKLDDRKIKEIKFQGRGCVICMASTSILTEELEGKSISEVKAMNTDSLLEMLQLKLTPTRIKCAMLPLVTLKKGILDKEAKE
jgi:nitrogen fixation NifU-like protein